MKPEKVFKRYDVRGKYPEELNEDFVERMGKSLGVFVGEGEVVVCRDNKESSESLKNSLVNGIISTGVDVADFGVGTTDYAAFHGSRRDSFSVMVTSSHMPLDFNGLKFMYPKGNGFLNQDLNSLKKLFKQKSFPDGKGGKKKTKGYNQYIEALTKFTKGKGGNFSGKVVVDSLGGAAKTLLPEAMRKLGFEVIDIAEGREQVYRNPPKPQPELLEEVSKKVDEEDADLGVGTDLDGDRIRIYYNGEWISGDDLFCVFAQIFKGKVVASIDTSKNLEKFSEVIYTRVGDPFVTDRMLKEKALLSGEPNGHYCFSEFVNYNSGILAACLAASTNLNEKLGKIPETFQKKKTLSYENEEEKKRAMKKFKKTASSNLKIISEIDGIKFSHEEASVLVRPSGTSPKIRVKSEARSPEKAEEGMEKALAILEKE